MDRPRRSYLRQAAVNAGAGSAAGPARRHRPDYWLLILTAFLLTLGIVVVYSISPALASSQHITQNYFITKQLIAIGLGLVAFTLASYISLPAWRRFATPLVGLAVLGSLIVMVMPLNELYQAHRWIRFGSYSIQVAELIKLALVVWLARFLTDQWQTGKLTDWRQTFRPLLTVLLIGGVVVAKFQSDLGSAAVMVAIMGLMVYSVGIPMKRIAMVGAIVLGLVVLAISTSGYRRDRFTTFLHPQADCQTTGYQACQALISVGSGGVMGLGLGYSVQAYGYLPEPSNDSIFAIMAEKFGFIGSVALLSLYGVFIFRLKKIAERTADQFSRLIVIGVLAWLSTQMLINIGAMIGLLPLKGITLPLISQGGTSLLFMTAALGLVFHISRYTSYNATEPKNNNVGGADNSADGRRVGRSYNPNLVSRPRT